MSKIKLVQYVMILSLILPPFVLSQTQEIKEYKIIKGDTLWSISNKELSDPFLWPKIWKENPEITNPDRLYPGQTIKIPFYVVQKEKQETPVPAPVVKQEPVKEKEGVQKEETAPVPVKLQQLVNKNILLASGYISDTVNTSGEITGSPSGRNLFGNNDVVYVRTDTPVKKGDKFYIIREEKLIKHPLTDKEVGRLVNIVGILEIAQFEYGDIKAKITQSFDDIITGDLLDAFYELNPMLSMPSYRKPDIKGVIIASKGLRMLNSVFNIVYVDKGQKDGIEIGDMFKVIAKGKHITPTGIIQIINCNSNTSTAIVKENFDPIAPGNLTIKLE